MGTVSLLFYLYLYNVVPIIFEKPHQLEEMSYEMQKSNRGESVVYAASWCSSRLGNKVTILANMYAYKEDFGIMPVLPIKLAGTICYYFQCKEQIPILERVVPDWKNKTWVRFDPDKYPLPGPNIRYVNIDPMTVKLGYYLKYMNALKEKFLTLKERFQHHARKKIEIARNVYLKTHNIMDNESISYIGIHVRNTDYIKYIKRKWNKEPVAEEYFTRAMNIFRKSEKHPLFIIVSDDMVKAKNQIISQNDDCLFMGSREKNTYQLNGTNENIKDDQTKSFIPRGLPVSLDIGNDIALLLAMNHSIRTYGTFALWTALLSDSKMVIWPEGYNDPIKNASIPGWTFV